MLPLPPVMLRAYDALLAQRNVVGGERNHYRKWLRYYLDYCHKYHHDPADRMSFSVFHQKLSSKNQSESSCRQAHRAVVLYHEMLRANQGRRHKGGASASSAPEKDIADLSFMDQEVSGIYAQQTARTAGYG